MGTVAYEFSRFVGHLFDSDAADDVRRVAKIVQAHLEELLPTGTARGQRAVVLAPHLRTEIETVDAGLVADRAQEPVPTISWNRLRELALGPFRGFPGEERFDLNHDVVLFYGPNGSGKTSICEAFELCLLGYIEEAEARRFRNTNDYVVNIHEKRGVVPSLTCSARGGPPQALVADAELYRFCIIERNRIDSFARIAARSSGSASDLIGALLGLEEFDAFVQGFTANLNSQLSLGRTPHRDELERRQRDVEADHKLVEGSASQAAALDRAELELAQAVRSDLSFDALMGLLGEKGEPGRLQELERLVVEQLPPIVDVDKKQLRASRLSLRRLLRERAEVDAQRKARATDVSFEALYRTVLALRAASPTSCPACSTGLGEVVESPYVKAERGLAYLHDLVRLERKRAELDEELRSAWSALRPQLERLVLFRRLSPEQAERARVTMDRISKAASLVDPMAAYDRVVAVKIWRQIMKIARRAHRQDQATKARIQQRAQLVAERDRLVALRLQVAAARERRRVLDQAVTAARLRVEAFQAQNADLMARAAAEQLDQQRDQRVAAAYAGFMQRLSDYRQELPRHLAADLNEVTRELYNAFNASDRPEDRVVALTIPLTGEGDILFTFQSDPDQPRNALHVLSEGHIRCLGLAILLAQNIKQNLPLIIFDDPVNAIDHDHRGGIRDTLLGHERLRGKQIIVTSHSNEFVKDIQNHARGRSTLYVLRHHDGNHRPKVKPGSTRNYLERAESYLDELDLRGALAYARPALETLTQNIWRKLDKEGLGEMTLTRRGPDQEPDLRHFTEELRKNVAQGIGTAALDVPRWQLVLDVLDHLLGIGAQNNVWRYLNKGVHEEQHREEFEAAVVTRVVAQLKSMDDALRMPRTPGREAAA